MREFMARPYCPRCKLANGCECGLGLIDLDGELIVGEYDRYDSLFRYYARLHGLDWRRIKAQAVAESSLDPRAVSPAGAVGLMQFMPATWSEWGKGNPTDPEASIEAACKFMAHLYSCYGEIPEPDQRYKFALAAYNWGRANVNRVLTKARGCTYAAWESDGRPQGPWQMWGHVAAHMPTETRNYVSKIMGGER